MDAYSIGYVIGQWMVEIVPVLVTVAFLAIIGPTTALIMFLTVTLLALGAALMGTAFR